MKKINGIMMQYFEWYLDCKQNLWNEVKENAKELAKKGITALWLPPVTRAVLFCFDSILLLTSFHFFFLPHE